MKATTTMHQFNNLIVYATQSELDVCLASLFKFKKALSKLLQYKLTRLSVDVINPEFFCCSIISNCDKITFMLDSKQVHAVINGNNALINQVLNPRSISNEQNNYISR